MAMKECLPEDSFRSLNSSACRKIQDQNNRNTHMRYERWDGETVPPEKQRMFSRSPGKE